jgi:hypothetical protein
MKLEDFVNKIKYCWKSYDSSSREFSLIKLQKKIGRVKEGGNLMGQG